MTNPSTQWDRIPVYGVYMNATDSSPVAGTVQFILSERVTRTDGRIIYPNGATVQVTIGNNAQQDATIRSTVRAAWRAADQAAEGGSFDGTAWDTWFDTKVVPAAIFTSFPAADDPDILQTGFQVLVKETLPNAQGKQYAIQPLLSMLSLPIPGINLGTVLVPPGTPNIQPVYAKGIPGGVAALNLSGQVLDGYGSPINGSVYVLNAGQSAGDIPSTVAAGTLIVRKLS